jgi:hypothetical protein
MEPAELALLESSGAAQSETAPQIVDLSPVSSPLRRQSPRRRTASSSPARASNVPGRTVPRGNPYVAEAEFRYFHYWNREQLPEPADSVQKWLQWTEIADTVGSLGRK